MRRRESSTLAKTDFSRLPGLPGGPPYLPRRLWPTISWEAFEALCRADERTLPTNAIIYRNLHLNILLRMKDEHPFILKATMP